MSNKNTPRKYFEHSTHSENKISVLNVYKGEYVKNTFNFHQNNQILFPLSIILL